MNRTNVVAEVGRALRTSLAASLQVVARDDGTARPEARLKLLRLAVPAAPRGGPSARGAVPGEPLPELELDYLAWIDDAGTEAEERLIGAVLAWLHSTPLRTIEASGGGAGPVATWQVQLTPLALHREELLRLWSVTAFAGRTLLAFEARVTAKAG